MLKRIIILTLAVILSSPSQGKTPYYKRYSLYTTLDTVLLKVNYLRTFKECEGDEEYKNNIYELLLGEELSSFSASSFYYYREHPPKVIIEKAQASKDSMLVYDLYGMKGMLSHYEEKHKIICYKNYPEIGTFTLCTDIVGSPGFFYAYEEPLPVFDWQLEEGDSIVCGYPCSEATTTFRGRTWRVWYTLDIPYSDGPWKLGGLPGLILKATDSKGDFDFTAIAIEEQHSKDEERNKITIRNIKYVNITPQRYEQLLRLYYDNIIQYHTALSGARIAEQLVQGQAKMGVPLIPEHKTPCLIEYYGDKKE